jgi:hypothetical protein
MLAETSEQWIVGSDRADERRETSGQRSEVAAKAEIPARRDSIRVSSVPPSGFRVLRVFRGCRPPNFPIPFPDAGEKRWPKDGFLLRFYSGPTVAVLHSYSGYTSVLLPSCLAKSQENRPKTANSKSRKKHSKNEKICTNGKLPSPLAPLPKDEGKQRPDCARIFLSPIFLSSCLARRAFVYLVCFVVPNASRSRDSLAPRSQLPAPRHCYAILCDLKAIQ